MDGRLSAKRARHIRRRAQQRSHNLNCLGFSEMFLAPAEDAAIILATDDLRLKYWLLGFTALPPRVVARFRSRGWAWSCGNGTGQAA